MTSERPDIRSPRTRMTGAIGLPLRIFFRLSATCRSSVGNSGNWQARRISFATCSEDAVRRALATSRRATEELNCSDRYLSAPSNSVLPGRGAHSAMSLAMASQQHVSCPHPAAPAPQPQFPGLAVQRKAQARILALRGARMFVQVVLATVLLKLPPAVGLFQFTNRVVRVRQLRKRRHPGRRTL